MNKFIELQVGDKVSVVDFFGVPLSKGFNNKWSVISINNDFIVVESNFLHLSETITIPIADIERVGENSNLPHFQHVFNTDYTPKFGSQPCCLFHYHNEALGKDYQNYDKTYKKNACFWAQGLAEHE